MGVSIGGEGVGRRKGGWGDRGERGAYVGVCEKFWAEDQVVGVRGLGGREEMEADGGDVAG